MMIGSLFLFAFVAAIAWSLFTKNRIGADLSAQEILDQRLAKGEIEQQEYQTLKKAIGHDKS